LAVSSEDISIVTAQFLVAPVALVIRLPPEMVLVSVAPVPCIVNSPTRDLIEIPVSPVYKPVSISITAALPTMCASAKEGKPVTR